MFMKMIISSSNKDIDNSILKWTKLLSIHFSKEESRKGQGKKC